MKVTPDPRVRLVGGNRLQISNANTEDAGDYICQVATMHPIEIVHNVDILGMIRSASHFQFVHAEMESNLLCNEIHLMRKLLSRFEMTNNERMQSIEIDRKSINLRQLFHSFHSQFNNSQAFVFCSVLDSGENAIELKMDCSESGNVENIIIFDPPIEIGNDENNNCSDEINQLDLNIEIDADSTASSLADDSRDASTSRGAVTRAKDLFGDYKEEAFKAWLEAKLSVDNNSLLFLHRQRLSPLSLHSSLSIAAFVDLLLICH